MQISGGIENGGKVRNSQIKIVLTLSFAIFYCLLSSSFAYAFQLNSTTPITADNGTIVSTVTPNQQGSFLDTRTLNQIYYAVGRKNNQEENANMSLGYEMAASLKNQQLDNITGSLYYCHAQLVSHTCNGAKPAVGTPGAMYIYIFNTNTSQFVRIAPIPPTASNLVTAVNWSLTTANFSNLSIFINGSNFITMYYEFQFSGTGQTSFLNDYSYINGNMSRPITQAPVVTLSLPTNNTSYAGNTNVTFECNVTADNNLVNMSLYHNATGTFAANQTRSISGTSNSTRFVIPNVTFGAYTWNCLASDNGGFKSFATNNFTFRINDNIPPTITFVNPTPANATNQTSTTVSINTTVVDLFGTIQSCILTFDNTNFTMTRVGTGTSVTCNYSILNQADGQHIYKVYANDSYGNWGVSEGRTVKIDTTPPAITFINPTPANNANQSSTSVTINVSVVDATTTVEACVLQFDNVNYTMTKVGSGSSVTCNYTQLNLGDGAHTYLVFANDSIGNSNKTGLRTVTVDTAPPIINYINPTPANGANQSTNSVTINVTVTDVTTTVDKCVLQFDNVNYSMTKVGSGSTVTCSATQSSLSEGTHTYKVFANDTVGNMNGTGFRTVIIDTAPPIVNFINPTPANGANQTSTSATINVSVIDITTTVDSCVLQLDNVNYTMTKVGSGNVTCNYTALNLADGTHTYYVFSNDSMGNSNTTGARTFRVDTTAPAITFINPTPANGANQSSNSVTINISAVDATTTVSACVLQFDNTNYTMTKVGSGSSVTCNYTVLSQADGTHTYVVFVNDSMGNTNRTTPRTVTIDTTPPLIFFVPPTPNNGTTVATSTIVVNITAVDATTTVGFCVVEMDGTNYTMTKVGTGTTVSCNYSFLGQSDGQHIYFVFVNDSLGNANTSGKRYVTVDTTGPIITFVNPTPVNAFNQTSTTVSINVTAVDVSSAVDVCRIQFGNTNYTMTKVGTGLSVLCNYTFLNQADGIYIYRVFANDSLGNNGVSELRTVTIDTAPPIITYANPTPVDYANQTANSATINVSVYDYTTTVDRCVLEWNGVNQSMTKSGTGANVSCSASKTSLVDGVYTYRVYANDTLGNSNKTAQRTLTVDTTPPSVSFVSPTPSDGETVIVTNVTINLTAQDLLVSVDACVIQFNNTNYTMTKVGTGANVTCNSLFANLPDGTYYYRVYVNDSIGNSNYTNLRSVIVGSTGPVLTYLDPTPANGANQSTNSAILNVSVTNTVSNISTCWAEFDGVNQTMIKVGTGTNVTCRITESSLTDGAHTFRVYANDTSDKVGQTSQRTFTVDTSPPIVNFINPTPANGANQTSTSATINVSAIDVTTTVDSCILQLDNVNYSMTKVGSGSSVICNYSALNLADGTHTYYVFANDSMGNSNRTGARTFKVDTTAPTITFINPTPANGANQSTNSAIINISAVDATTTVDACVIQFDNANFTMTKVGTGSSVTCNYSATSLSEGTHSYVVFVNDSMGNTNRTGTRTFTVDTIPPTITFINPTPANGSTQASTTVIVNLSAVDATTTVDSCVIEMDATNYSMTKIGSGSSVTCNYTFSGLGDGQHTYFVFVNDSLGNANRSGPRFVTVDTVAPTVTFVDPTPADGVNQTSTSIVVNVTAVDATSSVNTCLLQMDSTNYTMTKVGASSSVACNYTFTSLTDGVHTYVVYANDSVGNMGNSGSRTVRVDTTAPIVNYVNPTPPNGANQTSTSVTINVTAVDATTTVDKCVLQLDNTNYSMTKVGSGNVTCNYAASGLSDGVHTYYVFVNDSMGNSNRTGARTVNVATQAPAVTFVNPTPANGANQSSTTLTVNVTVISSVVSVSNCIFDLDGTNYTMTRVGSGSSVTCNYTALNLPDGVHTYSVYVNDSLGTVNRSQIRTITIDTKAPIITFVNPTPANYANQSSTTVSINATVIDNLTTISTCILEFDGVNQTMTLIGSGTNVTCNFTKLNLVDGTHSYRVYANDSAGNMGASENRSVNIDTLAPGINFVNPTPINTTNQTSTTLTINVTAIDSFSPIDRCTLDFNGANESMTKVGSGNSVSCNVTKLNLADGTYTYKVYANDTVGNSNVTDTRIVTIDTTGPVITFIPPTDDNGASVQRNYTFINVTSVDGMGTSVCLLDFNGTNYTMTKMGVGSAVVCYYNKTNLDNGIYTYRVYSNDSLGNNGESETRTITIATTVPTLTFVAPTDETNTIYNRNYTFVNVTVVSAGLGTIDTCLLYFNSVPETMVKIGAGTSVVCSTNKTSLNSGNYTFRVFANDSNGNFGNSGNRSIILDYISPNLTFINPTPIDNFNQTSTTLVFNVSVIDGVTPISVCTLEFDNVNETMTKSADGSNIVCTTTKNSLSDGNHTYKVYANDSANNIGQTARRTVYIDTQGPAINYINPTPVNGANQSSTSVTINISAIDATTTVDVCLLEFDSVNYSMTKVGTGSSVTCNYTMSGLSQAVHTYRVYVNDSLGNFNVSATRTLNVDLSSLNVTYIDPTPANGANQTTNLLTINVSVSSSIAHVTTCILQFDDVNETITRVGSGTSVTCNATKSGLSDGNHTYRVYVSNSAGNTGVSGQRAINIDTTPPTITFVSPTPADGANQSSTTVTINVSAVDAISPVGGCIIEFDSVNYTMTKVGSGSSVLCNYSTLSQTDGTHTYRVFVNDTLGNANRSSQRSVTIDTSGPSITYVNPTPANGANQTSTTVTINVTSVDATTTVDKCLVQWDNTNYTMTKVGSGASVSCNYTFLSVADGTHTYKVFSNDTVGNMNAAATRTINVDTSAPAITFVNPTPADGANQTTTTVIVNITAVDAVVSVDRCVLEFDSVNYSMTKVGTGSSVTCSATRTSLTDGTHTYRVYVNDSLGNSNVSSTRTVNIATQAPAVTFVGPTPPSGTNTTTPSFTANVTAISSVVSVSNCIFDLDGVNYTMTRIGSGSSVTCNYTTTGLPDGIHTYSVYVNDSLGNVNRSEIRTLTVDTTPPVITFVNPSPADTANVSSTTITFNITAVDALMSVNNCILQFNNLNYSMTRVGSGTSVTCNYTALNLPDGTYSYKVYANDSLGNIGGSSTRTVTVDTNPPVINFVSPTPVNYANQSSTTVIVNLSAVDSLIAIDSCVIEMDSTNYSMTKVGSGTSVLCNYTFTGLSDGLHTYFVFVNDSIGNANTSGPRYVTVDTSGPSITYVNPTPASGANQTSTTVTINVTSVDATTTVDKCLVQWDNTNYTMTKVGSGASVSCNYTFLSVADGTHTYKVFSNDTVSNMNAAATRTVNVATQAPAMTYVNPTPANGANITSTTVTVNLSVIGSVVVPVSCILEFDGINETMSLVGSGLSKTCNFSEYSLTDGGHTYRVYVRDIAGNTNVTSLRTVYVDTAGPSITFVNPTPANGANITTSTATINTTVVDTVTAITNCILEFDSANESMTIVGGGNSVTCNATKLSLAEGSHTYRVYANDSAGNVVATSQRSFRVDTLPPVINFVDPTPGNGANQTSATVTINVTAVDATTTVDKCVLQLDNTNYSMTKVGSGNVTCNYAASGLSDGVHTYYVFVNDSMGNSNRTGARTVNVATQAPAVTFVGPTPPSGTNTTTPSFTANVTAISSVVSVSNCIFDLDGVNYTMTRVGSGASVTCNYTTTGLPDGVHTYSVYVNDSLGTVNRSAIQTLIVDTTAPLITFINPTPANGANQSTNSATINISAVDAVTTVDACVIQFDNANFTMTKVGSGASVTCNYSALSLSEGTHSYVVFVNDSMGNSNRTTTRTFTVDTTPPVITFVNPTPANGANQSSTTVTINITAVDSTTTIDVCTVQFDDINYTMTKVGSGNSVACNYSFLSLSDGQHTYKVFVNDSLGNANATSLRTVTIDTTKPDVVFVAPTPANGANQTSTTATFNVTATDATNPIDRCLLEMDNVNYSMTKVGSGLSVTCNYTFLSLADGTHSYKAYVNDTLGNTNVTETRTLTVDSTAPNVTFISPTPADGANLTTTSVTFNVSALDAISSITNCILEFNNTNYTMTRESSTANTSCSYAMSSISDGVYVYRAYANDSLGNVGVSSNRSLSIDTQPPVINILVPSANVNQSSTVISITAESVDAINSISSCTLEFNGANESMTMTRYGKNASCSASKTVASGIYNFKVYSNDSVGNSNVSGPRTVIVDTYAPEFISLTTNPTEPKPNQIVTVTANVTENLTGVSTVILQYFNNGTIAPTNLTMNYVPSTLLYNVTFNATEAGNYTLILYANNSVGNWNYSANVYMNVSFKRTWTRTPTTLPAVSAGFLENVTLGVITLENTGDFDLNFTITSDYQNTTFNQTFPVNITPSATLGVNVTATAPGIMGVTDIALTSSAVPGGVPSSLITTARIVTAEDAFLDATMVTYPTSVNRGDNNVRFRSILKNVGQGNATNITFFYTLPSGWVLAGGTLNITIEELLVNEEVANNIEVNIPSNAATGNQIVIVNATGKNATGADLGEMGNTRGQAVTVLVNVPPSPIGPGNKTEPQPRRTTTSSTISRASSSGGAVSGKGSGMVVKNEQAQPILTKQLITIVRGSEESTPLTIMNPYSNAVLEKFIVSIEGFMSQYISVVPIVDATERVRIGYDEYSITERDAPALLKFWNMENHQFKAVKITEDRADFLLMSKPMNLSFNRGQMHDIDFNGDGENDIAITLLDIMPTISKTNKTYYNATFKVEQFGHPKADLLYSMESRNFSFNIFVPPYLKKSFYNLTIKVSGILVPMNPQIAGFKTRNYTEFRDIVLRVTEVSPQKAELSLESARNNVQEMINSGIPSSRAKDLLSQAENALNASDYEGVMQLIEKISALKKEAFAVYNLMAELTKGIDKAKSQWLTVPETERVLSLARRAYEREDFVTALERAKDAQLLLIYETKEKINVLWFLSHYWWAIILGSLATALLSFHIYKRLVLVIITQRLKNIAKEHTALDELIKEAQVQHLKEGTLSAEDYKKTVAQYEARIIKISQLATKLRNRRVSILQTEQEILNLDLEEKELIKNIQELQGSYLMEGKLTRTKFLETNKQLQERLSEIEEEKGLLQEKLEREKISKEYIILKWLNSFYNALTGFVIKKTKKSRAKEMQELAEDIVKKKEKLERTHLKKEESHKEEPKKIYIKPIKETPTKEFKEDKDEPEEKEDSKDKEKTEKQQKEKTLPKLKQETKTELKQEIKPEQKQDVEPKQKSAAPSPKQEHKSESQPEQKPEPNPQSQTQEKPKANVLDESVKEIAGKDEQKMLPLPEEKKDESK